jgi:membrane protease YdiL (CAAX protease family)
VTGPAPEGRPHEAEPGSADPTAPDERADDTTSRSSFATSPAGPPGGGIFTLEGRRAPGLYLVAWILTVAGLAVTFVLGPMASDSSVGVILIGAGALAVTLGLAAGAGSQILERADRRPDHYRGPSPLLVFAAYFFVMSLVGLALVTGLGLDPERPFSFLGVGVVQAAGYVLIVWLFAVRSGALSWRDMGWPALGARARELLRDVVTAAAVMVPVTFGLLIVGGIVGLLLGVDAPQVLPLSETVADGFMVVLAAAIIIPVGEEIFFRGFALTAWRRDLGERSALIRSALFFALVHVVNIADVDFVTGFSQALLQTVVLVPVAFVLGWLFLRYGIIGAISGHVTYNSLLLILAFIASQLPEPGTSDWPTT